MVMASNSKSFQDCPPQVPLSGSLSIRAPLTLYDSDSNSEFEVSTSSNATLSDIASESDTYARPSVPDPEEPDYVSQEEEELSGSPTLRVMPFAYLSTYDDDELDGESEVEGDDDDDDLFRVVRVPLNFQEENAETSVFMNYLPVSKSLLSDDLPSSNDMSSAEDDDFGSVGIVKDLVVEEEEHDLDDEVLGDLNIEQGKVRVVVLNQLEEKEELCGMNTEEGKEGIPIKLIKVDSIMQGKLEVDMGEATHMVQGSSMMFCDTGLLKSTVQDYDDDCRMSELNSNSVDDLQDQNSQLHSDFGMAGEAVPVSDAFAENVAYSATHSTLANGSQGFPVGQESECLKMVSITKPVMNSKAKLHDSSDDACEGDQIQNIESSALLCPTLPQETTYLKNDLSENNLGVSQLDVLFCDDHLHEYMETGLNLEDKIKKLTTVDLTTACQESNIDDDSPLDVDAEEGMMSVSLEQFKEQISALSILLGSNGSGKNCQQEQSVTSSHENTISPGDDAKGQSIHVASGGDSDGSTVTITSADESSVFFFKNPTRFSYLPHCESQSRFKHKISENEKEKIQKIQDTSVKFLRLVQRVNLSLEDSLVSKVLCRLVADIGRRSNQEFVIESAKISAKRLEDDCEDDLDFSLNILVLGKTGVGKSATINSIFGDTKVMTNAFEPATTSVKEVSGTIGGIKIRILDTPGLRSPMKEQAFNRKILSCIKKNMKKFPPDVILYVDRVDAQSRDLNDLPLLRTITSCLSPSVWKNSFLTLTHAASIPLDAPSGSPLSYEVFVAQKSYLVQQSMRQAVGDVCQLSPSFMCPVSLVENHPLCGKNISGECILPNGLRWRSQLLASCISMKILSEVSSSMPRPQTLFDHWKHFFFQNNSQPLGHVFSSILESPAHLKFPAKWN